MKARKLRIGEIILLAIALSSFACSIFYYPRLVEATRSGLYGNGQTVPFGDSNLSKTFGFSSFMLVAVLLYIIIPRLRHKPPNYKFRYYDRLMIWLFAFWVVGQYFGLRSESTRSAPGFYQTKVFLGLALASLFLILGDMCSRLKPSWPILKNRWIRQNPQVLNHTITSIGWWLKATGISSLMLIVLPTYFSIPVMGVCLLIAEFYIFVYPLYARFRARRRPAEPVDASTEYKKT